jgi:hypothetical protein
MTSIPGWQNPTQSIGLASCLLAFVCCAIAWIRGRSVPLLRKLSAILAVLEAALFLDMAFNGRWLLHDWLENQAIARGLYDLRTVPQIVALCFLGGCAATGIALVLWHLRGKAGAALAACGGILSVGCWCVEVVSLHAVDHVLYSTVDGVMLVALAWIAFAIMTGGGILWHLFAFRAHAR